MPRTYLFMFSLVSVSTVCLATTTTITCPNPNTAAFHSMLSKIHQQYLKTKILSTYENFSVLDIEHINKDLNPIKVNNSSWTLSFGTSRKALEKINRTWQWKETGFGLGPGPGPGPGPGDSGTPLITCKYTDNTNTLMIGEKRPPHVSINGKWSIGFGVATCLSANRRWCSITYRSTIYDDLGV
ncbi:MAG: hypothetical protein COB66_03355 [Coxiella sp. (in: Bacteria)]|nr:MAG: hypothetical protein COB66_03355 [Coxiella sp. (in: g-proteobacteria)]